MHKTPYTPPLFRKIICALHCRSFEKHLLFKTFLLVLAVGEVCYISNKYQPPNNSETHQCFYTRDFISLLHFKKNGALHREHFSKHPLFTLFSLFLTMGELCYISHEYWLPIKSANKMFLQKEPYTPPLFQKNLRSPLQKLLETSIFYNAFTSFDSKWGLLYFK